MGAASVAGIAPAAAAPPPAQSTEAFCANVPESNPFGDVSDNVENIVCMAFTDITTGLAGGTTYGPGNTVTRAQMASFIARMIDTVGELALVDVPALPASGGNAFTDDDGLAPHEANINRLAAAGVVAGVGGGRFAPNQPVTRAQMATFINNAQAFIGGGDANRFVTGEDYFTDDETQTAHEANINGLASVGIVQGGPGGIATTLYGPVQPVNRSQMASFVIRYLGVLEDAEVIKAPGTPPPPVTIPVTPAEALTVPEVNADGVGNPDAQSDNRVYTASDLTPGKSYRVSLIHTRNITSQDGKYTFVQDGSTGLALEVPNAGANIVLVAGGGTVTPGASPASPQKSVHIEDPGADGTVTFTVDAVSLGNVTPVIYEAPANPAHADSRLNIAADGTAEDFFGVGGAFTSLPAEADDGQVFTDWLVVGVDKANNVVSLANSADASNRAADRSMVYGDNADDNFTPGPSVSSFEAKLSAGDLLSGTYQRGTAEASTFNLNDAQPDAPVLTVTQSSTTAVAHVAGLQPGSTARVYLVKDGAGVETIADATEVGSGYAPQTTTDIAISNLEPSTKYVAFAREDSDGQLSPPHEVSFETTATPSDSIEITGVSVVDLNTIVATFSGDVNCGVLASTDVVNEDDASDEVDIDTCAEAPNGFLTQVELSLIGDMTNNESYILRLAGGAVTTLDDAPIAAQSSEPFQA